MSPVIPNGSYPIREFARITGVIPATLRAWERRYGIIRPLRTEKGHRFFNEQHVARVRQILYWLEQGYPIRQVKLLLDEQDHSDSDVRSTLEGSQPERNLAEGNQLERNQGNTPALPTPESNWNELKQALEKAIRRLDIHSLNQTLNDVFANYPLALSYQQCLYPVMQEARSLARTELGPVLYEAYLKRRLIALMQQQQRHAEGPLLLLASNQADAEIDLLIRACSLGAVGIRVELVATLTPEQSRFAIDAMNIRHCWLHFYPMEDSQSQLWLTRLQQISRPCYLSGTLPESWAEQSCFAQSLDNLHHLNQPLPKQIQWFVRAMNQTTEASPSAFEEDFKDD